MVRVDERAARAFAHLRAPEFSPLVDYLKARRQDALEQLAQVNLDVQIYRLQGEAVVLKDILGYIEGAEALLAKLKDRSRP